LSNTLASLAASVPLAKSLASLHPQFVPSELTHVRAKGQKMLLDMGVVVIFNESRSSCRKKSRVYDLFFDQRSIRPSRLTNATTSPHIALKSRKVSVLTLMG